MTDDEPVVSVIIPVFNGAQHVLEAIESVRNQTFRELEIIVVDDGSSDGTRALLKPLAEGGGLRYRYQENQGLSGARNTGIQLARGRYLKFLDHDDLLYPEQIERQVDHLREKKDPVVSVSSWECEFVSGNRKVNHPVLERDDQLAHFLVSNRFPVHAALVSRERAERAGGFDVSLRACEDLDLWLRILMQGGAFESVHHVGCRYRILSGSMSADSRRLFLEELKVYEKASQVLISRISELSDETLRGWYLGSARRARACFAHGIDPAVRMPTAMEVSHALLARTAPGWKKGIFGLLGSRNIFQLQYLIASLMDRDYSTRIARAGWRDE